MNRPVVRIALVAAACGFALAACNAVSDAPEEAVTPAPVQTVVLQGKISGLGSRRPVVLQYNGADVCVDAAAPGVAVPCRFFGVLGQQTSAFSFGSLPVGTSYDITVKTQPFAKICTVTNGSGVLGSAAINIVVSCVNDPAVPRYAVRGSISPEVAATPGLKVRLATEEGVREIDGFGRATFEFPDAVFDSQHNVATGQLNLPVFGYAVTATTPPAAEGQPENNCAVASGTNIGANGNATTAPTGDVTGVAVTSCRFAVRVGVNYTAATGQPLQPLGSGGVTLALRNPVTGLDVQAAINVTAFTAAGSLVSFPVMLPSNANAIYELVVAGQPAQQTCIAGFGTGVTGSTATDAGAVLLLKPAPAAVPGSWLVDRAVLCRAIPAAANQLRGAYQLTTITTLEESVAGKAPVITVSTEQRRNFLVFFEDGTFLYGVHNTGLGCSTSCGVQHGFYEYNAVAHTLAFSIRTDTVSNTAAANKLPSALTLVARAADSPGSITARISGPATTNSTSAGVTTSTTTTVDWRLQSPPSIAGQMTGAWVTADHRRMWIYEGSTYAGFHAGVNGMGNAQDACFPVDPPTALAGYFTRRGNATTCQLGDAPPATSLLFTMEVPNTATVPAAPAGFIGGWPQSRSNADGRPSSPVLFTIEPGTPDRLTVQDTAYDGTPVNPPIVLTRITPG